MANATKVIHPAVAPDVLTAARVELAASQTARQELRKRYAAEKQVSVYLSPMYKPYFGRVMRVGINGVCIDFPVDGRNYKVPMSFASEIVRRRQSIDNILEKQKRMSEVAQDTEGSPGSLRLF